MHSKSFRYHYLCILEESKCHNAYTIYHKHKIFTSSKAYRDYEPHNSYIHSNHYNLCSQEIHFVLMRSNMKNLLLLGQFYNDFLIQKLTYYSLCRICCICQSQVDILCLHWLIKMDKSSTVMMTLHLERQDLVEQL